ncbi:Acetyltransferase (GNAT) domain-containing protein [Bacillus sp. OV194]|nr:Acetyltransferase (GNAT) domain-containing protein [Bacillus sp. OV194]
MTVEFRSIKTKCELEDVFVLLEKVFNKDRAFFEERIKSNPAYHLKTTWVAIVNGKISSVLQVFPFCINVPPLTFNVAGIGNVATMPANRGQKLGHRLLDKALSWMEEEAFDLSLLYTGIPSFYEKAGWHSIPENYHYLYDKCEEQALEDGMKFTPVQHSDLPEIMEIYQNYSQRLNGPMVRTKEYWTQQLNSMKEQDHFLVAKHHNQVTGYIRFQKADATIDIIELCHQSCSNTVFRLYQAALSQEENKVLLFLPTHHELFTHLSHQTLYPFEHHESMWKIISKSSFTNQVNDLIKKDNGLENIKTEDHYIDGFYKNEVWTRLSHSDFLTFFLQGKDTKEMTTKDKSILRDTFIQRPYIFWRSDHF